MTIDGGTIPGRWRTQSPDDVVVLRCKICPMAHSRGEPELLPHAAGSAGSTAPFLSTGGSREGRGHARNRVAARSGRSGCAAVHAQSRRSAGLCHTILSQLPTPIRDPASNAASNIGIPSVAPPRRGGLLSPEREYA